MLYIIIIIIVVVMHNTADPKIPTSAVSIKQTFNIKIHNVSI